VEYCRCNPDINWNKVKRHWENLQKTLRNLRIVTELGLLDTPIGEPLTRGEEGLPRRKVFDQGEFHLGHDYLSEEEAKIRDLDRMMDLVQSLGGRGEGMSQEDIDLATSNIQKMSNFLDKTQSNWKEFLENVAASSQSTSGLLFDCLNSYIDATTGIIGRSKRKQTRAWGQSMSADRDALADTLQLDPERDANTIDWWPPREIEDLFASP
jgi:hypothetical protein